MTPTYNIITNVCLPSVMCRKCRYKLLVFTRGIDGPLTSSVDTRAFCVDEPRRAVNTSIFYVPPANTGRQDG